MEELKDAQNKVVGYKGTGYRPNKVAAAVKQEESRNKLAAFAKKKRTLQEQVKQLEEEKP